MQQKELKARIWIRMILFLVLLLWILGIFSQVIFRFDGFVLAAPILNLIYSHTCHQNPAKTIFISGKPLFVCTRCLGIYSGMLVFSIVLLFLKKYQSSIKFFFISCLLLIADVFLYNISLYNYSKVFAFITGFLLGSSGFFLILQGLDSTIKEIFNKEKI